MSDSNGVIEHLIARARQLHSLPAVAMEVLKLTKNPRVDAGKLKTCIENDPALTVKLLKVVNSSLFGLSREVSDLNQALALLGTKPLKLLVLGFSLPSGLFEGVAGETLEWYWRRTLTKAVAGREIAEQIWKQAGDDAFIAGLLQDIGMLLLIQDVGEPYIKLVERVRADGSDIIDLEDRAMGFDHTRLTARLLKDWGLPNKLVATVSWETNRQSRSQHDSSSADRALTQIVHMAEMVARLLVDRDPNVLGRLLARGRQYHNFTEEQLDRLVVDLEEKIDQLADVLSLQLPSGLDYSDVLSQAYSQLSEVAESAAEELISQHNTEHETVENEFKSEESLVGELESLSNAVSHFTERGNRQPAAQPMEVESRVAAEPVQSSSQVPRVHAVADRPDRGILEQLTTVAAACRQSRCALSLLLVEWDDNENLLFKLGLSGIERLMRFLQKSCEDLGNHPQFCMPSDEFGFALIVPDCERAKAVQLGHQLVDGVQQFASEANTNGSLSVSVGIATVALPPKNFQVKSLIESAERCVYGAHASGGGVVKSIEIY